MCGSGSMRSPSGILLHDPDTGTYELPAEHAALLTRAAAPDNLAAIMQYIPLFGAVEDLTSRRSARAGASPTAPTPIPGGHGRRVQPDGAAGLLEHILPSSRACPIACRRGSTCSTWLRIGTSDHLLAAALPEQPLQRLRPVPGWRRRGPPRGGDAAWTTCASRCATPHSSTEPEPDFDLICTFDAVHDQAAPLACRAIHRALRPGGVYLMQDIAGSSHVHDNLDHPLGPLLYTVSCLHCMTVSLAEGAPGWARCGASRRPRNSSQKPASARSSSRRLDHDTQNVYVVARPQPPVQVSDVS